MGWEGKGWVLVIGFGVRCNFEVCPSIFLKIKKHLRMTNTLGDTGMLRATPERAAAAINGHPPPHLPTR